MEDADDHELTPERLMALIAADVCVQEIERRGLEFAGLANLFRAQSSPANRALLTAFDAACDRFRAQWATRETENLNTLKD